MFGTEMLRRSLLGGLFASSIAIGGGMAVVAQDGTPAATPEAVVEEEAEEPLKSSFTLIGTDGNAAAFGSAEETEGGLLIRVANSEDSGLEPGEHGIHLHQVGDCTAEGDEPFATAGGHFNPTGMAHGGPDSEERHAGDLGNLTVNDDGSIVFEITVEGEGLTLDPEADPSLADEDGSALLIHANPDDLTTDPSGESGGRVACGLVAASTLPVGSPVASPIASPVATPVV
ncbi:MAG: superoxide dismutase family protein [Chloroflexia bacterium]|nr:superoxide dismutase family protein [Chloroflexia bacterium]